MLYIGNHTSSSKGYLAMGKQTLANGGSTFAFFTRNPRGGKAKDIDSTVTGRTHGHPVRCLRNQMTREYVKLENEGKSFEELEYLTLGTLRKAVQEGDVTNGTVMAGQIAGMVSKEQTCKEMIDEMMAQAEALLGRK